MKTLLAGTILLTAIGWPTLHRSAALAGDTPSATLTVYGGKPAGELKGLYRQFSGGFEVFANTETLKPHLQEAGTAVLRFPVLREPDKGIPFFKGQTLEDAGKPEMYDFKSIDHFVARVHGLGLEIFAGLASMPPQLAVDGKEKGPPKDPELYAQVIKHVVLHLTQGWADGHRYPIRYWEVWNEPDLADSPQVRQAFFTGTREQFFEMYAAVSRAIKSIAPLPGQPEYKVGGPAFAHLKEWPAPFLEFCAKHELPLDFFSFHHYDDNPTGFETVIRKAHDLVQAHPRYRNTELILNEWNMAVGPWDEGPKNKQGMDMVFYVICNPKFSEPRGAVHLARSLMLMERSPVSRVGHFLLTDNGVSKMGVITCPEIPIPPASPAFKTGPAGPKQKFFVLKAFQMLQETPRLVEVQKSGDKLDALAGVSADGQRLTVLLVNWGEDREVELGGQDLPWAKGAGQPANWAEYVLDQPAFEKGAPLHKAASGQCDAARPTLKLAVPAQSVVVVTVQK
ncbi:MAG: GH39 family glycosyl hydrolase [Planctomycetaceae bacterium]